MSTKIKENWFTHRTRPEKVNQQSSFTHIILAITRGQWSINLHVRPRSFMLFLSNLSEWLEIGVESGKVVAWPARGPNENSYQFINSSAEVFEFISTALISDWPSDAPF